MGVPKGKKPKAKCRSHRAGMAANVTGPAVTECPQCHSLKQPHSVCPVCGYYNGRQVVQKEEAAK